MEGRGPGSKTVMVVERILADLRKASVYEVPDVRKTLESYGYKRDEDYLELTLELSKRLIGCQWVLERGKIGRERPTDS